MLTVNQINKTYNLNPILKDISFTLKPLQRVGIIGANGSGKSTLFRIMMKQVNPDSGTVQYNPEDLRIGYLPQGIEPAPDDTIESFLNSQGLSVESTESQFKQVSKQIALDPQNLELQKRYDHHLQQLTHSIQHASDYSEILFSLGLGDFELSTPVQYLSGGQKTRLALASVILSNPQCLLLDEPTNHLDIKMLEWLERWLNNFRGAVLLVSHDRSFLDATVNGILRIDTRSHTAKFYNGNYSDFLEQHMVEQEKNWQAYQDQQDQIGYLRGTSRRIRSEGQFHKGGKSDVKAGTDGFSAGFFKDRALETMRRAKSIEKRLDKLMGEDNIEKPKPDWEMKMEFQGVADTGRDVLLLEDLSIGYEDLVLASGINLILRNGQRCALIGENGTGKTTLIKTIMKHIPPLEGNVRLGTNVKIGYLAQEQETLNPDLNPFETIYQLTPLNETETRYFLSKYLFKGDEVFVPNSQLSFGERARLNLACLVADGCNFLILDEPINHLDIPSRSQFEQSLANFNGTVLAVVHDRYFIDSFATEIWELKDKSIKQVFL